MAIAVSESECRLMQLAVWHSLGVPVCTAKLCADHGGALVYLQGLLQRPDWAEAARLPLCQVPGGSGNALAANCGLWSPVTAAHAICKACT